MSKEIFVSVGSAIAGILAWLTIRLFKHLMKRNKKIRRSIFVTTITVLMAMCGLAIGLAVDSGQMLTIILTLYLGTGGALISVIVSLVLYRKK